MKRWLVALVLGVPAMLIALLMAVAAVMVLVGAGDPLQPSLGALHPDSTLAVGMWLGGLILALALLVLMACFSPWGVLFARRPPRKRYRSTRENEP